MNRYINSILLPEVYELIGTKYAVILIIFLTYIPVPKALADTFSEILQLTINSNKQLVISRGRLVSQKASIDIAEADRGLNLIAGFNSSKDWDLELGTTVSSISGSIQGTFNILDGRLSKNRVLLEQYLFSGAEERLLGLEQNVLLATINSYLNVLRDQKLIELSKGNVVVLTRQFQEIKDRFSLGEVTRTDVAQAESALAAAKANLVANQGALAITSEIFFSQVGIMPGNLEPVDPVPRLPENLKNAKSQALKNHPQIKYSKIQERAAEVRIELAKGAKKPQVNFKSSVTNGYNEITGNFSSASIGFEGRIQLYDSGKLDNIVKQAEENLKAELSNSSLTKRLILQELSMAWSNLEISKSTIEARKRQVEASKIAYDGVVVEEKLGIRTTLNVINAEQDLLQARTQLASSERDNLSAIFSVLAASGLLTPELLGLKTQRSFVTNN